MRGGIAAAVIFGAVLVAAQPAVARSGGERIGPRSMSVTATPHTARAHAVRVTVTLRYEMQCNYPGAGPLAVTFPAAMKLPRRIAAGAVRLRGKRIAATVDGRHVTVTIPPHRGSLCNVLAPGSVTLTFTRGAKLANPARAGSYGFRAKHAGRAFAAKLRIAPAG